MYRYLGAGLPNVYLESGYEETDTPYGKTISIHDIEGLHDALGEMICSKPEKLTGYEFRFLRTELDLSQATLAEVLGCDVQSVSRWENGKTKKVNATAERLLRVLYEQTKLGKRKLAPLLDRLQKIDANKPTQEVVVVMEQNKFWHGGRRPAEEVQCA
jgi:DNA-binding transcriptional regulator YiaG